MKRVGVVRQPEFDAGSDAPLRLNTELVTNWLVCFLRDEMTQRRGFTNAVIGISGGVDSSLVAYLCARALGPDHVYGIRMPYKLSSPESLDHARLVVNDLGIREQTIDITGAVDGYVQASEPDASPARIGNVCARMRMIVLFDQSAKLNALPVGTGNKTERLFGYFTWHADDAPPVNPIGDLFKTQVWELARYLGVPNVIVDKPATADLVLGQTDEADFGISYPKADRILYYLVRGYTASRLKDMGFDPHDVQLVKARVDSTHWKRHLPTTAVISTSAINEFYLRPVDY